MNELEALDAINDLCPFDDDPTLTLGQQHRLLALAGVADADGRPVTDPEWTPTYDRRGVLFAAREGWRIKAGRSAGRFDFTTDGQMFKRSQLVDHIEGRIKALDRQLQQNVRVD